MAKTEIPALQGIDVVLFARKLSEAGKVAGQLIPYQTSLSFDPQRDSDTNPTKSGSVGTSSSIETDLEVEFINNWSKIADQLLDSLFNNEKMEFWIVYRKRRNKAGKYYAIYMRGTVNEDETDGDPDDTSNRDTSITVDGTPQRGWTDLPDEAQEELDYVFRGVGVVTDAKDDGTDGGGAAWTDSDAGTGSESVATTTTNTVTH